MTLNASSVSRGKFKQLLDHKTFLSALGTCAQATYCSDAKQEKKHRAQGASSSRRRKKETKI